MTDKYTEIRGDKTRVALSETRDCAVIALAILTGLPYAIAHREMKSEGRKDRGSSDLRMLMSALSRCWLRGMERTPIKGITVATFHKRMAGSTGRYLIRTSGHVAAFVDGQVQDWTQDRRHRIIEVYKLK